MFRQHLWMTVLLIAGGVSWAQSPLPPNGRDYLYPVPGPSVLAAPAVPRSPSPIDKGEAVVYSSFQGVKYQLTEFRGKNVSILLPPTWLNGLTLEQRRTLLDRSDLIYEHFRELVGQEPSGDGMLRIAFVTSTCGWGCGWIGAKGVEVMDADWSLADAKGALAYGHIPGVVTHEMTHNFDVYAPYLHYLQEHAHAWTAFLDSYIQIYSQQGYLSTSPKQILAGDILRMWTPYVSDPSANWLTSVRNGNPAVEMTHLIWGGLHHRFAELHGVEAVRRAMRFWQSYAASNPIPSTAEAKEDLDIEGLAAGARLNLSCYVDAWKWYASPSSRTRMAAQWGNSNAFCVKGVVKGEFDDRLGSVASPVVDEFGDFPGHPYAYPVAFPVHINATAGTTDSDFFQFTLPSPGTVKFVVRASPGFQGYLHVHAADRVSWLASAYIPKGQSITTTWKYPTAGSWAFEIWQNETVASPNAYSVDLFMDEPWPLQWGVVNAPQHLNGSYQLSLTTTGLPPTTQADRVRFWVSGFGFVGTVFLSQNTTLDWTPPSGAEAGTYTYRAQAFYGETPVTSDTSAQDFSIAPGNRPPVAIAGANQNVECTGVNGAEFVLDGSKSYDADGDALTFRWTTLSGTVVATTARVTLQQPLGTIQTYRLTVSDGTPTGTSTATTIVKVRDTTPPDLRLTFAPAVLWPPNGKFVPIQATVAALDRCDAFPKVTLVSITSNEPAPLFVQGAAFFTDDRTFALRAERDGGGSGRVYTVTYRATDNADNRVDKAATVRVPHDQGK